MSYIKFDGVNKYFGQNHVLRDISLDVEYGEFVTLLGPSGCGKSTLLRCLAGLETVSGGSIFLDGKDITDVSPKNRNIGMVFQQYSLFPNLTIAKNVAFGLTMQRMPKQKINNKVLEILELVGLREKLHQYPYQLSGGQQQRVALARSLVMQPKVLLLDEPLSAIDALLRRNLQTEIRRIQKELNITTVFVTHDQDEAMIMSDRVHLFNMGNIEQSGRPVEIYTQPSTLFAATFIGHYNLIESRRFALCSGSQLDCEHVAIRPEIISLSVATGYTEMISEDCYCIVGSVRNSLPRGNIIRYTIDCGEFCLDADILFDVSKLYENGQKVHVEMKKENVLSLSG
jgi:putative spermidine/putrescine transport system ATP-binding protein